MARRRNHSRRSIKTLLIVAGVIIAAIVLVAVALLSNRGSASRTATYIDSTHGFTLTYDKARFDQETVKSVATDKKALSRVGFSDVQAGDQDAGGSRDYAADIGVVIYRGNGTRPAAGDLAGIAALWNKRDARTGPNDSRFEGWTIARLAGRDALSRTGSFDDGGTRVATVDYVVFEARYWYEIHLQGREAGWPAERAVLMGVAETFRVTTP